MALITFADKVTFQASPLSAEKKATAADYNEIKNVVNANAGELIFNKEDATIPPDSTNNLTEGYTFGSKWNILSSGQVYLCTASDLSTAIWRLIYYADTASTINSGVPAADIAIQFNNRKVITLTLNESLNSLEPLNIPLGETCLLKITQPVGGKTISSIVATSFITENGIFPALSTVINETTIWEITALTTNDDYLIKSYTSEGTSGMPNINTSALVDGAAIAFDFESIPLNLKTLTTVEATITLTLSNVTQGANQVLSVIKNIAGDVTITLAGTGLTFYGYNNADLGTTPDIILSGASGEIFDISFLARTATKLGVAIAQNGD